MRQPGRTGTALTYLALTGFTALTVYPVLLVLKKAFEPTRHFASSPSPIPDNPSLGNFEALLGSRGADGELAFLRYAGNSALVALATTVVGVALACTAAYALSRWRFRGRRLGLTAFLAVQMFPATLLLMPLYVVLDRLGLLNSLLGLVLVYATTAIPFCVWTLKGYFDTLPRELEEAARIDGASSAGVFFRVILPLARPGIVVATSRPPLKTSRFFAAVASTCPSAFARSHWKSAPLRNFSIASSAVPLSANVKPSIRTISGDVNSPMCAW
jgi:arabinogalactan oligomer/maltooligosaccharide transport system permease protein